MVDRRSENEALFKEYSRTKDVTIRDRLIVNYLYIADILSRKFVGKGIEYDDIYQIASLALIYAVERFDASKGFEFTSFATPTIVGEIKKHFRDKGWMVRVPRRLQELSRLINLTRTNLEQRLQREVTIRDLAREIGCTEDEIMEAMEASMVYNTKSLDLSNTSPDGEGELTLLSVLGKEDKGFTEVDNKNYIDHCLKTLNPAEQIIIRNRFLERRTQVEVAEMLNVSQMTVSRMEKKLIKKFREEYYKKCLQ